MHETKLIRKLVAKPIFHVQTWQHSKHTFFCKAFVEHQLSMPQIIEYWTKVGWVSVNQISTCFILVGKNWKDTHTSPIVNTCLTIHPLLPKHCVPRLKKATQTLPSQMCCLQCTNKSLHQNTLHAKTLPFRVKALFLKRSTQFSKTTFSLCLLFTIICSCGVLACTNHLKQNSFYDS